METVNENTTDEVNIGGRLYRITRLTSVDKLYDELASRDAADEAVADEQIPYWADLWPSAIGLARYVANNPALVKGRQVLEIGCGLGLPGIVAARLGARVTMTDYLGEALKYAALNARQNGAEGIDFYKMDWRRPNTSLAADLVIASDVAYESRAFAPLPEALKALVKPGGMALVSEPGRAFAKPFFGSLGTMFRHAIVQMPVEFRGLVVPVGIHKLERH